MSDLVGIVGMQTGTFYCGDFRIEFNDVIPAGTYDGSSQGWRFRTYSQIMGNKPVFTVLIRFEGSSDKAFKVGESHVIDMIDYSKFAVHMDYVYWWSETDGLSLTND